MKRKEGQGSDFVLSTTVTETILLLFFLLLLLLVYTLDRSNREKSALNLVISDTKAAVKKERVGCEAARDELQKLEDRLAPLLQDEPTGETKGRIRRALVALSEIEMVLAEERNSADSIKREIAALNDVAIKVKERLAATGLRKDQIAAAAQESQCESLKTEVRGLAKDNRQIAAKQDSQARELTDAHLRNRELQERYKRVSEKSGKGGDEYVACWKNGDEIEYVFVVHLENGRVRVERAWPDRRGSDMAPFVAEKSLVGKVVGLEEFLQNTREMFASSKRQTCRHFVDIVGKRVEMDRINFTNYQGVQNHFYKRDSVK